MACELIDDEQRHPELCIVEGLDSSYLVGDVSGVPYRTKEHGGEGRRVIDVLLACVVFLCCHNANWAYKLGPTKNFKIYN